MADAIIEPYSSGLEKSDWDILLTRIEDGRCLPIIGPGICSNNYPSKAELATKWADEERYPFVERTDLCSVAQFLALKNDESTARDRLIKEFNAARKVPDFSEEFEPHRVLAGLGCPLYITTNYDDYMFEALKWSKKDVSRESSNWNNERRTKPRRPLSPANPIILHLYGHTAEPDSLILTERDYMRFLLNFAKFEDDVMPSRIQGAFSRKSLLFIGYKVDDWDFRFLLAFLERYFDCGLNQQLHIAAQIAPLGEQADILQRQEAQAHFNRYLKRYFNVSVYWGSCQQFMTELALKVRSRKEKR